MATVDETPAPRRSHTTTSTYLRRAIIVAGALIATAAAGIVLTNVALERASHSRQFSDVASAPARRVAIVPGSRVEDGRPLTILGDRLEAALALYRRGSVRAILVSGQETAAAPETSVMRAWLRARGVLASDILTDEGGSRTRETMNRAAAFYDVSDAIVCTQTVNMARTLFLARAAGIDAVGVALPTHLSRSRRYLAVEALKTTLAVIESAVRGGPDAVALGAERQATVAAR
jgi:vancomycin permeability regulator SanA